MTQFIQLWWATLPPGAISFLIVLLASTAMLVRAGMHPTMFALVSWPGTLAHELSHAVVGFLLFARPCSFSLLPKNLGNGRWQLGAVGFTGLRWWNAPWTAMAPMLLAPMAVGMATNWAYPVWAAGDLPGGAWRLGMCTLILQAAWPSSTDLRIATPGLMVIGLGTLFVW